ncbi:twin transmembrane helix small protein [Leisingera caerulea]|uniref:Twin transmembrane helix small protein n=1 Tax=Leisingera caerulea TaxID=506591 RepID=A0A9Q9HJI4_LEICA|nr:twin transmembrane helix small protein [Leisingera caerulea]UWQ50050.1 twin transmembrane helix small protein [Leisingera caerulea]UWQ54154.1 twin transmembrane helix small protein [Leisingera caerulea]UWQ58752.1 twin transmembrane helix small protein [Leisingera caerulea]UWQ62912.1 twin transmembrane helix small protein [Leisingera caerulea]UWQ83800.1 twin transmembrane helix small protein [Leisingera caerulea]
MSDPLYYLALAAVAAVVVALVIGIGGFGKGGAFNRRNANKMMRLRILFQFIAVVLLLSYVYLRSQGG